jgi:hypothetical protein
MTRSFNRAPFGPGSTRRCATPRAALPSRPHASDHIHVTTDTTVEAAIVKSAELPYDLETGGWAWAAAGLRGVVNDAVAFYFPDTPLAGAFVARWCAAQ